MTKAEAIDILDRFSNWNHGQKSITFAFRGSRTDEDDILDARRRLIQKAYDTLNADEPDQ